MTNNATPQIFALKSIQQAIDDLSDIDKKDTEIISAIRDLKNARSRVLETIVRETRGD